MVNEDWLTPRPLSYRSHLSPEWHGVREIFSELHLRYNNCATEASGNVRAGQIMRCLYFTCVHPDARRQGVMGGLWRATIDVARDHGFSTITAQSSTATTRRVLESELGFSKMASVSYSDFVVPKSASDPNALSGKLFADLVKRDTAEYGDGLTIHARRVPSDLYV